MTATITTKPLFRRLAATLQAIRNCKDSGNHEWLVRHEAALKRLQDILPSGTAIDRDACTAAKLVLYAGYDGWNQHTIIVTPSFDGIDIRITGGDRSDIKDALTQLVDLE